MLKAVRKTPKRKAKTPANKIEAVRHSLSHLMTMAVQELYPQVGLGVGPAIENGFYQDYDLPETITPEIFPKLEKRMREMIGENIEFKQHKVDFAEAYKFYRHDPYKTGFIDDLKARGEKKASFYKSGWFDNLCGGPHVGSTKEIDPLAFKLDRLAGAYWRGDEKNKMLTRIYGLAFATKKELDEYLARRDEAEKRDHKKLGVQLDLFTFSDLVGAGLPLWTPKGTLLRDILNDFVWNLRKKRGYERVEIPHITKKDLYERSGHWEKFKNDLFRIKTREGHEFAMKPMNCPHHTQIYARRQWSYRELPQRYENTTMVYRDEQSGELSGLARVLSITQDDAHVFCRTTQIKEEFLKIWDIVHEFYGAFGFKLRTRLSLHDGAHMEKYLGSPKGWKVAEGILREIVTEKKGDWFEGVGEAAFYGPKLDFMASDSLGREWQVATIQLDMNMPERFDLFCINEKGEQERIVMIHAAIMGSIERFLSIIIEHFAGAFSLWMAPVQARTIPVSEKFSNYAIGITEKLKGAGIRAEIADANETLGKRIREAELQKIPYVLVVGEREEKSGTVSVRHYKRGQEDGIMETKALVEKMLGEIKNKTI